MNNIVNLDIEALKLGHLTISQEFGEGATVRDVLVKLNTTHPVISRLIFDSESRELTGVMAVILNGKVIQSFNGLDTAVNNEDLLVMVPLIDGG